MTRRLLIAFLTIAAVPCLWAQSGGARQQAPENGQERLAQMKERLKLTPEQEEQVRPIITEGLQKARTVTEKSDRDNMSRRQKLKMARELKSIREETDKKLKTVLTREQMSELARMREERREKMKEVR